MNNPKGQSWWQTMPGILTALTGLVTAIAALIGVLYQSGLLGDDQDQQTPQSVTNVTEPAATPLAAQEPVVETRVDPHDETTDGWSIIGKARSGSFFDLKLMVHGDSPAIGRRYDVVEDFRLVQKRPQHNADDGQVVTLGTVRRGDSVEVLDLYIPTPSTETVSVWAKLRAVL